MCVFNPAEYIFSVIKEVFYKRIIRKVINFYINIYLKWPLLLKIKLAKLVRKFGTLP